VTAILQLKVVGSALVDVTERLASHRQMVSVYETTGDHDIIAIGKFHDTDDMNDTIKNLLTEPEIKESNTSVVLNPEKEHEQFDLEAE
jgi:DNA-binding Lrp family transcriptional regulator